MFEGGGFGVGLTVDPVGPVPWPDEPPPGVAVHPARLGELMPVAARSRTEKAVELQRVTWAEGALAAYKAELVAGLARDSSDDLDVRDGRPGAAAPDWAPQPEDDPLAEVSEFFPDELAMTLNCSRAAATTLADVSLTLVERLPATWAALADGYLDWPRARVIASELGWPARECDPRVVAEVEAAVLPVAMELSIRQLRTLVQREMIARDAAAAELRRKRAERSGDVNLHSLGDGIVELRAPMPAPVGAAVRETVDTYARMAKADGDLRPLGQLRVAFLADLVLRPWDTTRPPVTASVTVIAPLDALSASARSWLVASPFAPGGGPRSDPGTGVVLPPEVCPVPVAEVDGVPITAAHLRELLRRLDALRDEGLQAPIDGSLTFALTDPAGGGLRTTATRREIERIARLGCLDHPDGACACPLLDRPEAIDRYRPTPAQYRYVRTRDRSCRHPGCHGRAGWSDLDHVVPHNQGGATDCANLCCSCRRHHRLKTHAQGWRYHLDRDGTLHVTTPTGITRTTRPPGLDLLRGHRRGGRSDDPPPEHDLDDDPPPF